MAYIILLLLFVLSSQHFVLNLKFNFVLSEIRSEDDRRTVETCFFLTFIFLNSLHICYYPEISYGADEENLFEYQELLKLVIIFMTLKFDSGVIL